jgi:hypothetical protein
MMSDFVSNMFEHDSAATYNLHIWSQELR